MQPTHDGETAAVVQSKFSLAVRLGISLVLTALVGPVNAFWADFAPNYFRTLELGTGLALMLLLWGIVIKPFLAYADTQHEGKEKKNG